MAFTSKQAGNMAHGADLFLDILTKEEKEALLNKKMEEIRRKNEALRKRHEEIEADKRLAEKKGMAMPPKAATSPPPPQPQFQPPAPQGPPVNRSAKGVNVNGEKKASKFATGRGKRLANMSKERLKAQDFEKKKPGGPGPRQHGPYGPPVQQGGPSPQGSRAPPEPKSPATDGPPPDPAFNFLADRSREGPLSTDIRRDGKRHPRNFGGSNLNDVKSRIQVDRERQGRHQRGPPQSRRELEIKMTGRERREYMDWKAERERIDQERVDRQKRTSGDWKREWDKDKDEFATPPSPPSPRRTEPGRRPGGSDSANPQATSPGFRDNHDTRHLHSSGSRGWDNQRQEAPSAGFHDQHDNRHQFSSTPRRGRGGKPVRGGSRGGHQERPPRMRVSSSGSEDGNRSVEKQNDSLLVKIDNEFATSPPTTKEVRKAPRGTKPARGKSGQSRGAGGGSGRIRPPRSSPGGSSSDASDVINIPVTTSTWKPNPEAAEFKLSTTAGTTWTSTTASTGESWNVGQVPQGSPSVDQTPPAVGPGVVLSDDPASYEADYEGHGGDDEWEDAEDSTEFYKFTEVDAEFEEYDDLHNSSAESLERFIQEHTLKLNVDSTGITPAKKGSRQLTPLSPTTPTSPTSPGVIKTPEGHIKVLDWAAEVEENYRDSRSSNASEVLSGANVEDLSISSGLDSSSGHTPEKRRGDGTVDTSLEGGVEGSLPEVEEYQTGEVAEEGKFEETVNAVETLGGEDTIEESSSVDDQYAAEGDDEEEDEIEEESYQQAVDDSSLCEASKGEALPDVVQEEDRSSPVADGSEPVDADDSHPQEEESLPQEEDDSCQQVHQEEHPSEAAEELTKDDSTESATDTNTVEVVKINATEEISNVDTRTKTSEDDSNKSETIKSTSTEEGKLSDSKTITEISSNDSPSEQAIEDNTALKLESGQTSADSDNSVQTEEITNSNVEQVLGQNSPESIEQNPDTGVERSADSPENPGQNLSEGVEQELHVGVEQSADNPESQGQNSSEGVEQKLNVSVEQSADSLGSPGQNSSESVEQKLDTHVEHSADSPESPVEPCADQKTEEQAQEASQNEVPEAPSEPDVRPVEQDTVQAKAEGDQTVEAKESSLTEASVSSGGQTENTSDAAPTTVDNN